MPIAFDAAGTLTSTSGSAGTWAHVCSGNILFAGFGQPVSDILTGITYGGVSMTFIDKSSDAGNGYVYLYGLSNPPQGNNNIIASMSGTDNIVGASLSYTFASAAFPDAHTNNTASINASSSLLGTVTTVSDNCWLVLVGKQIGGPIQAGANTTFRGSSSSAFGMFDSNGAKTPPGAFTLAITNGDSTSRQMAIAMASFAPAGAGNSFVSLTGGGNI